MSRSRLPPLTHLQFLVLAPLLAAEQPGRALRRELALHGVRRSRPAFYQMMGRLEEAGWVDGSYTQKIVQGQIIKERRYRITAAGARAWTETRTFYTEASRFVGRAALVHG